MSMLTPTLCSALLATVAPHGATQEVLRPLDVFELEWAAEPEVAPDGRSVVYVRGGYDRLTDRRRGDVWRVDVASGAQRPLVHGASSPRLSPDGARLAYIADAGAEGAELFVRWLDTGETVQVTRLPRAPSGLAWSPSGAALAFVMPEPRAKKPFAELPPVPEGAQWAEPPVVIERFTYRADGEGYVEEMDTQLFVVPADGGTAQRLTSGPYDVAAGFAWTPDGEALVFSSNRRDDAHLEPTDSELWRVARTGGELLRLTTRYGPDAAPAFAPDGRLAYLGSDEQRLGYSARVIHLREVDGATRVIGAALDRSIDEVRWSSDGNALLVRYVDRGDTLVARLDPATGAHTVLARGLAGDGSGRPYAAGDFAEGGGALVVTAGGADRPADLALALRDGALRPLTRLNEDVLAHRALARLASIEAQSTHDGRALQGWVLYPPGFTTEDTRPLLLEIHGGPFQAYGPCFSFELQLYAAAGYVVVYGNPRGSTSYGAEFANQIHHAYPSHDGQDLVDLVDAALARGGVDPARVYVTGGSGGGVLTAWLVGTTERFRAAVVVKPVINWTSFVLTADMYGLFARWWFPSFPWEDPMHYWQRSPLSKVGAITAPTMVMTGEEDFRTPISESEQLFQALKLRGIDTALVRIPGASHGITSRPSRLIAAVLHVLTWFERYGGASATWWK
jgi:dipeptidyl aminopeptidase/acylaminoacyl peptidase